MANQHPRIRQPTDKDLGRNPGIGTSRGTIKGGEILDDDESLDGDTTFKGDIENDATPQGGIDPSHTGRTNK